MDKIQAIIQFGNEVVQGKMTWVEATARVNQECNCKLSVKTVERRYKTYVDVELSPPSKDEVFSEEWKADGSLVLRNRAIWFDPGEIKTKATILQKLGYSELEFRVADFKVGSWEGSVRGEPENRIYTTISCRLVPTPFAFNEQDLLDIIETVVKEGVKPLRIPEVPRKLQNLDLLMLLPAIELHLGKLAWSGDSGQDYDSKIAEKRFHEIIETTVQEQYVKQADRLLVVVGGDFFNSDTPANTTTAGTQMNNDTRYKKMQIMGIRLYTEALLTLREHFNNIDVILCEGNHDRNSAFNLFLTLTAFFSHDDKINFSQNYLATQAYQFGKCALFFNHGEPNFKRLVGTIAAEFPKIWGNTIFRELILGHLHKEMVVDDNGGLITRRIGSPTGTDSYHYDNRFIGATQKHQVFTYHKDLGLQSCRYVNFENRSKERLRRRNMI